MDMGWGRSVVSGSVGGWGCGWGLGGERGGGGGVKFNVRKAVQIEICGMMVFIRRCREGRCSRQL